MNYENKENLNKISIIIPAYNVGEYIESSIISCLNQTYKDFEIIVVNDGSTDNTAAIIECCASKDNRIKFVDKENEGVSKARNTAIDAATGRFVVFLDGDDMLEKTALETLIKSNDTDNWLVACGRYLTSINKGKERKICTTANTPSQRLSIESALLNMGSGKFNLQSACYKLFDKEIIDRYHIRFNENYSHGEDGLFVFEYLRHIDGVNYITAPLWNIYARQGSASRSPYKSKTMTAVYAVEDMINKCDNNEQKLISVLQLFCVERIETVLSMAVSGGIKRNQEDIVALREKLRSKKTFIRKSNISFIKKEKFYRSAYLPIQWLRASNTLESIIRKNAKSVLYLLRFRG